MNFRNPLSSDNGRTHKCPVADCPYYAYHLSSFDQMVVNAATRKRCTLHTVKWRCDAGHISTTTRTIEKAVV